MCKTRDLLTALLLIGALASVCHATPGFEWIPAPEPGPVGGATYPPGYTSWDLMYTVDTNISLVEIYMESETPAPGDFYQNPAGGITGPPKRYESIAVPGVHPYNPHLQSSLCRRR